MTTVYKITTSDNKTRKGLSNETVWGEGVEHRESGGEEDQCGPGWLHAYHSPEMAAIFFSSHINIEDAVLWECDADIVVDQNDKLLCTRLKTIKKVSLPEVSIEILFDLVAEVVHQIIDKDCIYYSRWMNSPLEEVKSFVNDVYWKLHKLEKDAFYDRAGEFCNLFSIEFLRASAIRLFINSPDSPSPNLNLQWSLRSARDFIGKSKRDISFSKILEKMNYDNSL